MTLRRRFALLAAVAVAVTFVLGSAIVYVVVRRELRGRVDTELRAGAARRVALGALLREGGIRLRPDAGGPGGSPPAFAPPLPPRDVLGLATAYVAVVGPDGNVVLPADGAARLPVTGATRAVAAGARGPFFSDASVAGTPVRVFTRPLRALPGYAVQVARPLSEVDRTLHHLALVLVLVSAGGIALAALLGRVVARTALTPVAQLTGAVEHVAQTSDLSRRIVVASDDEIGRLARGFNVMLAALESSIGRQRQLVADASHELRTPLTSLRTNIEVLGRSRDMPEDERRVLLADVVGQLDELGALVGDLVELAREQEPAQDTEDVRFDALVADAVARAQRRPGAPRFALALEPCLVRGVPARLDRAVANLLDNAAKWSPPGGEVEVAVRGGELTVRDHGPGIPEPDVPHVFERFYRAPGARGMTGSGLGLAIVRQVAELHGGQVSAEAAPGGGALLRLSLPAEPPDNGVVDVAVVDTPGL
jgi:two-component system, OmpR family, sensor histidine kinase MprB